MSRDEEAELNGELTNEGQDVLVGALEIGERQAWWRERGEAIARAIGFCAAVHCHFDDDWGFCASGSEVERIATDTFLVLWCS